MPDLFDFIPRARATDPATSHVAAARVTASGAAGRQAAVVRAALGAHPGVTSAELAAACGLDRYQTARRLPELRKLGQARNGGPRVCRVTGKLALTWWAVGGAD